MKNIMRSGMLFIAILFSLYTLSAWFAPYDETDDAENEKRSGVYLIIDYGTGCHYLKPLFGDLTKRLDKDGNHICRSN